jgi:hypothetical protein
VSENTSLLACKHPVLRGLRPARNCPLWNSVVIVSTFSFDVAGEQQRVSDFSEDEGAMNSAQETSRSGFRLSIHRAASIVQSPICSSSLQTPMFQIDVPGTDFLVCWMDPCLCPAKNAVSRLTLLFFRHVCCQNRPSSKSPVA